LLKKICEFDILEILQSEEKFSGKYHVNMNTTFHSQSFSNIEQLFDASKLKNCPGKLEMTISLIRKEMFMN
jgi:hypothetical protein